jgi:uncharacterized pyridoxal phosphate-containing UPF0001 family protein
MKQTAVEWLEQQLYKAGWEQLNHEEKMNICCTAKMMEKEQIVKAYESLEHRHGENYYNETFKQQKDWTNESNN